MALSEKSRAVIYKQFHQMLGEEATQEMLSYFPARDVEEPVTKEFFRAESTLLRSELRGEMSVLRDELRGEMSVLRDELRGEMSVLRDELRGEMSALRDELRGEMVELRDEMHKEFRRLTLWMVTTTLAFGGVLVAALH